MQRCRCSQGPVATEKLHAVRSPRGLVPPQIGKRHAAAELTAEDIACELSPRHRVNLGDDVWRTLAPENAEDPLNIRRHGEPPRPVRTILDREAGNLDGVLKRHERQEGQGDPMGSVLKLAVALAMPGDIGPALLPDRQRRGSPHIAALFVPDVDHLAWRVADRIVGPRGEP